MFKKEILIEAVKELLRVITLAAIPVIITGLENGAVDLKTVGVVVAVAILRFVDKYLHLLGKSLEEKGEVSKLTLGLTRF